MMLKGACVGLDEEEDGVEATAESLSPFDDGETRGLAGYLMDKRQTT
jgi:hypothetical protein